MTSSDTFTVTTQGFNDTLDITPQVNELVHKANLANGIAMVFVSGSTAGITTIEFESGAVKDLKKAIEQLVPQDLAYDHNRRWGDGNGFSHVRAALLGPSLSIPVISGSLQLGTWQQIVLVDFDNRSRSRKIIVQTIGD